MDAFQLFREFYMSLGMPLRALIEFKMKRRGVAPGDIFERPWLLYAYAEMDLGRHNAELIANLFAEFAKKRGVDSRVAVEALRSPEGWKRFVNYLEEKP